VGATSTENPMVRLRVFAVYSTLFLQYSQPESPISTSKNIFDNLPVFNSVATALFDEITRYLNTGPEHVKNEDLLIWWYEHRHVYPHLSRMALDYHTIPGMSFLKKSDYDTIIDLYQATSVAVERVFSQGRLVLPYVSNRLSAESIRALMCLGDWSLRGFVKDADVLAAAVLPDVDGEEPEIMDGWDKIA
jgi:hypothetical protein